MQDPAIGRRIVAPRRPVRAARQPAHAKAPGLALTVIVVIGACVLVSGIVGNRSGIAPPVLMLAAGILVGFVPRLRPVVRWADLPEDTVIESEAPGEPHRRRGGPGGAEADAGQPGREPGR